MEDGGWSTAATVYNSSAKPSVLVCFKEHIQYGEIALYSECSKRHVSHICTKQMACKESQICNGGKGLPSKGTIMEQPMSTLKAQSQHHAIYQCNTIYTSVQWKLTCTSPSISTVSLIAGTSEGPNWIGTLSIWITRRLFLAFINIWNGNARFLIVIIINNKIFNMNNHT